jgi:hypothetical protein
MKRILSTAIVMLFFAISLQAQTAKDATELTKLLKEFLDGAGRNDVAMHDRFWADDLIYTGSSGRRIGKADIMSGLRSASPPKPEDPVAVYTAEDIRIQQYDNTAIVAFRLVATTQRDKKTDVAKYLNTGTFLKRKGKWQVVAWQATKILRSEEDAKKEVAAAQAAFHQAILSADIKTLETLTDKNFIWTYNTGKQLTREQLLEQLRSGKLKYSKLETNNTTVSLYGDVAIVRGEFDGDAASFMLTFVSTSGIWKAVAMHTSRL